MRGLNLWLIAAVLLVAHVAAFPGFRGWSSSSGSASDSAEALTHLRTDRVVSAQDEHLLQTYKEKEGFSECWRDAVGTLQRSCEVALADQQERSRMALSFTNCQLAGDGKVEFTVNCPATYDVSKCVARLNEAIYPIYLQFRLHVDTLCFHVQQEIAQRSAQATVQALQKATTDTRAQMKELGTKASENIKLAQEVQAQNLEAKRVSDEAAQSMSRLLKAQEELNEDMNVKQQSLSTIASVVETINDKQSALSANLRKSMAEADEVARRQSEAIKRIGLSADTIKRGIEETKDAAAKLMAEQKALATGLTQVGATVTDLHAAQDVSMNKATRLAEQLNGVSTSLEKAFNLQLEAMESIRAQTKTLSSEADAQQRNLVQSSENILNTLMQLHANLDYVQSVAVHVESLLFYFSLSIAIVILTTARPLAEARFEALMMGPVLSGVVEKWLLKEACVVLAALGAVESPWTTMIGGAEFTTAVRPVHVRTLRWIFAAVAALVLFRSWWCYVDPETRQRRTVEVAVANAFEDAFQEGGLAAKYLVRSHGLEVVPTTRVMYRAQTPPPAFTP